MFNVLFALKNVTWVCINTWREASPPQQQCLGMASKSSAGWPTLPCSQLHYLGEETAGRKCACGAAAWKCPLVQPEVGPGKFPSTKQENDTNATSP